MLKGMMKALKYGMALCMAVSLSAYIPEIGIQEVKATEVTASAEEKWSGTITVSYTHLDVYKRQAIRKL